MEKPLSKTYKPFTSRMQARLLLVFCVVALLLVGLIGRLIYIMQVDGDRYAKRVLSRQSYTSAVLPYKRGTITDRNGTVLAQSELQYRLILDPKLLLQNPDCVDPTIKALQENFNLDNTSLQTILTDKPDKQYVILLKNLKYDVVQSFKELMNKNNKDDKTIVGVGFEEYYVRTYPYNALACDVLGFTSADNKGFWGIEEYYSDELNGTNGREYGYYDANLNMERIVKKAVNGNSIVSTIDVDVQRIIQEKIIEFNTEFGSKNIGILVMNPNNGGIIAMASNKEYNLNDPRDLSGIFTEQELSGMTEEQLEETRNALWKNDVISSGFEPGSTFKPVTIAAALEENNIKLEDTYICDGGEAVGGSYIHCSKRTGHGEITVEQALMFSCNDALMQIAVKEGKDIFYRYEKNFGFGKKTGIDLPGEETGIIQAYDNLNATELATSSFGQSFNSTMIQMAAAFSSLVNGGSYFQPHLMKQIVNDSGVIVKNFESVLVRQTVSEQTSDFIQEAMYQTVENGTANGAKVEGYAIGGKTGTAQKLPRDAKTYVVSFLGCAPAINPEMVIYVMIDEPQNVEKQADSSIATKFASKILNEILPVLGIYPEGDIDYLLDDDTTGTTDAGTITGTTGTTTENSTGTQSDGIPQEGAAGQNSETTGDTGNSSGTDAVGKNSNKEDQTNTDNQQNTQSSQNDLTDSTDTGNTDTGNTDTGNTDTGNTDLGNTNLGNTNLGGTQETGNSGDTGDSNNADEPTNSGEDEFNADAMD